MNYFLILFLLIAPGASLMQPEFDSDKFPTRQGELTITFIGHASLMFKWNGLIIYADPVMREADFTSFPKADIIFLTHQHGDHLDLKALEALSANKTRIIMPEVCAEKTGELKIPSSEIMKEWEILNYGDLSCKAVPAYNIKHLRSGGEPYHPKGMGVGYLVTFGDFKVLIAGDTEDIPEYKKLADENIDVAFLPMNIPYTMTPEMVVRAAKMIRPKILYPYHYSNTDTDELLELMADDPLVEVRIRPF